VIRLRLLLERGRAHPLLGPILLILVVAMLALVLLHAAQDDHGAATEVGALCLAISTFLGLLLLERLRRQATEPIVPVRGDRGPPSAGAPRPRSAAMAVVTLPLRR
jgi:hypothetical protein